MSTETLKRQHHNIGPWIGHTALGYLLPAITTTGPDGSIVTTLHDLSAQLMTEIRTTTGNEPTIDPNEAVIIFRRTRPPEENSAPPVYSFFDGHVVINVGLQTITVDQRELKLTRQEFGLLSIFASHPNRLFGREELSGLLWGDNIGRDNALSLTIGYIRAKLGDYAKCIQTRRCEGYIFSPGANEEKNVEQPEPGLWLGHAALNNLLHTNAEPGPNNSLITTVGAMITQLSDTIKATTDNPVDIHPDEVVIIYQAAEYMHDSLKPETLSYFDNGLIVDPQQKTVTIDGVGVNFSRQELDLLCALVEQPGTMLTREQLITSVWKEQYIRSNLLDTYISCVRRKLGSYARNIETLRGLGYRFNPSKPAKEAINRDINSPNDEPEPIIYSHFGGGLIIDTGSQTVTVNGAKAPFGRKRFQMLTTLAANPGATLTRRSLRNLIWGACGPEKDRALDAYAHYVRKGLGPYGQHIVTVPGEGYKFNPQDGQEQHS